MCISANSHPATNRSLLSSPDGKRHYETFRRRTSDGGKTWKWVSMAANSTADNLRPIAAYGSQKGKVALLWPRGRLDTCGSYSLDVAGMVDSY